MGTMPVRGRKMVMVVPWSSGSVLAVEVDGAAVLFDDAAADPEAEAGAVFALGGEEGFEDVVRARRRGCRCRGLRWR